MEGNRAYINRYRKSTVTFDKKDKRFNFFDKLSVGDTGYLDVTLDIEGMELEMDEGDNERKILRLSIKSASEIDLKGMRLG